MQEPNTLLIRNDNVVLNGHEVPFVTSVDIKDINPTGCIEVVLHLDASQVDVKYSITE